MQDIGIATSYDRGDFTPLFYHDKCDKYDYLTAIGCGAVAGIVDIFLVGAPGENKILPQWSDTQANHAVMLFAKKCGWIKWLTVQFYYFTDIITCFYDHVN